MGTSFADTIQPLSSEKYVLEGKNVTLSCNYSTMAMLTFFSGIDSMTEQNQNYYFL